MVTNAELYMKSGELKSVLEARGFAYLFLSQAFLTDPVKAKQQSAATVAAVRLFPFASENAAIRLGIDEVQRYLGDPANSSDEAFDRFRWDYTRMFIGPGELVAPPWESAYLTEDHLIFQPETLAVRQAFRRHGLATGNPAEPDDHIGLELDFMHQTCRLALEKAEAGLGAELNAMCRDQAEFLEEHLLKWAPAFAADVVKGAQTAYYRGMAHLLDGFLAVDRPLLRELLAAATGA